MWFYLGWYYVVGRVNISDLGFFILAGYICWIPLDCVDGKISDSGINFVVDGMICMLFTYKLGL